MAKRIIVSPPSHPGLLALLFFLLLAPLVWGYWVPRAVLSALAPAGLEKAAPLVVALLFLSPVLGFFNVVVRRRLVEAEWVELEFVSVLGIPVPVPRPRYGYRESILAVNVGGALIPLLVAAVMTVGVASGALSLVALLASTAIVALVTYRYSRIIEGVGIVVPGLLPPVSSLLSSAVLCLLAGAPQMLPATAYASAVYGTLLGADLLNLWLHGDRIRAWLVSIGGAGTFDGIFMSGVTAIILAAALF